MVTSLSRILLKRSSIFFFFYLVFPSLTLASTSAAALPIPAEAPEDPERSDFLGAALLISDP